MLHREAEFEQAELERALAISLAIEEERLRSLALIDRDHELDHSLSSEAKSGAGYNTAKVCICSCVENVSTHCYMRMCCC